MLAFATLLSLGFDKQALLATANQLQPVLGRMELFQTDNRAKVVVDYAHTPDALEKRCRRCVCIVTVSSGRSSDVAEIVIQVNVQ